MSVIYIDSYRFASSGGGGDPDALAYIAAVETADGQALEDAVKAAINAFVVGCKADGIYNAIKASCILAGARTLSGALVPLVGTAPTNFNFVSGDYNRKTGLAGDGSTKYLNSNRDSASDPQDNFHQSVFTSPYVSGTFALIGTSGTGHGSHVIFNGGKTEARNRHDGAAGFSAIGAIAGLVATSRAASGSYSILTNSIITSSFMPSVPVGGSRNHFVFARNDGTAANLIAPQRLSFYSIGESLALALLDARVTDLINAFGAAIP